MANTDFCLDLSSKTFTAGSDQSVTQPCVVLLFHSSPAKCPWRQMPQTMLYYTRLIVFHHLYFSRHEM